MLTPVVLFPFSVHATVHCTQHSALCLLLCDACTLYAEQSAMTTSQQLTMQQAIMSRASTTSMVLHVSTLTQLAQLLPLMQLLMALCHGTLHTGR
jgi:hypothetical protein